MGNNDNKNNNDLDDELVRSIEKLVEEETNVAKAFVDNSSNSESSENDHRIYMNNSTGNNVVRTYSEDGVDLGATRMIDSDTINKAKTAQKKVSPAKSQTAQGKNNSQPKTSSQGKSGNKPKTSSQGKSQSKASDSKSSSDNKKTVGIAVAVVVAAIVIIIVMAVVINSNNKKSYSYNYDKGMNCFESGDYQGCKSYFESALNTAEGKKNIEMMNILADIYISEGDNDNAARVLKAVLEYDVQNEDALGKLAGIYNQQGDGARLTELIKKYDNSKASGVLDSYRVAEPNPSEVPGTLKKPVDLTLIAQDGCTIYYTTNGDEPSQNSTRYTEPIKIEKDTVTIKAIAVNKIGVTSKTAIMQYTVSLQAPEAPVFSVEGTITEGTLIKIKNLEEGCQAYYTVDGTTPTANSIIYQNGIDLKAGNYVVSVVIINKSNLSSPITRKNITVKAGMNYTYAEAQSILVARMKELNILNSNGKFSVGGGTPEFEYISKKSINGIEMYYIRLDVSDGTSSTEGYYGVSVKEGKCYKITGTGMNLVAVEY